MSESAATRTETRSSRPRRLGGCTCARDDGSSAVASSTLPGRWRSRCRPSASSAATSWSATSATGGSTPTTRRAARGELSGPGGGPIAW